MKALAILLLTVGIADGATRYETIDEAIARGDLADVQTHLAENPNSAREGKNPRLAPLHLAILRKQSPIALALIEAGADVNQPDSSGRSPIHLAVERDDQIVLKALLEARAKPDTLDGTGWTPIHHAAAKNRVEAVQILLVGGANLMTLSARGGTPLHEAAASGSAELVGILLEAGVDPEVRSKTGHTALDIAREHKNLAAIDRLTENPNSHQE